MTPDPSNAGTSRRQFVAGGLGTLGALTSLPLLLAACGGDDEPAAGGAGAAAPAGPWTFKDDRGKTVSLDALPERIVMHEYAAVALMDYGIRPIGVFGSVALDKQPLLKDADLSGIESVGEVWGEVNLEALAALRPDLIVTQWWPSEQLLGGIKDAKLEAKMTAIAPIVGIHAQVPASQTVAHFDTLAGELGADREAPEIVAQRKRYDAAVTGLKAAIKDKGDLKVIAAAPLPDSFYLAKSEDYADLQEYESWGLNIVSGESKDAYWEVLSWENADKYPADLILYDARATAAKLDALAKLPVWPDLPAVKAGQLSPWRMEEAVNYRLYADQIEELTANLAKAQPVT